MSNLTPLNDAQLAKEIRETLEVGFDIVNQFNAMGYKDAAMALAKDVYQFAAENGQIDYLAIMLGNMHLQQGATLEEAAATAAEHGFTLTSDGERFTKATQVYAAIN